MHDRIAMARRAIGLTQGQFAERIGLTRNFIWMVEKGERVPSDRTITDICREFGVNEIWLRTGVGEMFRQMTRGEEIMAFIGSSLSRGEDDIRVRMVAALAKLQPDQWDALEVVVDSLLAAIPEKPKTEKG